MNLPQTIALPLYTDEDGAIRVSNTRVTLYTLLSFYKSGESPERLHEGFPTVPLADIHAIIAYYLANQGELDAYIDSVNTEVEQMRAKFEADFPYPNGNDLYERIAAKKRDAQTK